MSSGPMNLKEALMYVCGLKFGKIDDLNRKIGQNNVDKLRQAGFLSCGILSESNGTKSQDTWQVTNSACEYYKLVYGNR